MNISPELQSSMLELAKKTAANAYCKYSKFQVGAVVLAQGHLFPGCNVENASYGLTICAERSAVFRAVTDGYQRIEAVLIYTPTARPFSPCGACRQVIHEFGPESQVISVCDSANLLTWGIRELLSNPFEV